ncbi:Tfp pilus assembly PilM family ATPase [Neisseria sp. HSC-16F19]|nr:Tfp pilus assembly PilM family ATPase [Neisseria sp. HSC-16F19]
MQIKKNKANSKSNKASASKNGECIGLDITPQAIHTVLLSGRSLNQIRLEKYAITPLPPHIVDDSGIEDHDQLVSYLQQAMRQLGSSCKNITVSIPGSLVSLQTLQYDPRQTELDVEEFAEFEVSQTSSLESSSYDYYVLPETLDSHPQTVVVASCNRDDVDLRLDVFGAANIVPKQMDIDTLAIRSGHSVCGHIPAGLSYDNCHDCPRQPYSL